MERLVFIGPGRVGLALGYALVQAEAVESLVYHGRRPDPPSHPLFLQGLARYVQGIERPAPGTTAVLLTVPDRELPSVAVALAGCGGPPRGCSALHTSGVQGADLLAPLHAVGYPVGTLHPLQAVAHPVTGAERLVGSGFALSGEVGAMAGARRLVRALDGRALTVPTARRPLYHAAAVFASNYLVVLLAQAIRLFERAGVTREEAEAALGALARGTLENVRDLGVRGALTGPVARGDLETVRLHLRTLEGEHAELYAFLGRRALAEVREDLPSDVVGELDELFERQS